MDSSISMYVQPIASHVDHPERLLVKNQNGGWSLWLGTGEPMTNIGPELALWIMGRPETVVLDTPRYWFEVSSLPMALEIYDNEGSVAD